MANHLKLKAACAPLFSCSFSFFLGLWVFCCGILLAWVDVFGGVNVSSLYLIASSYLFGGLGKLMGFLDFRALLTAPTLDSASNFFFNPSSDIDSSAATDADDLVVFVADIFEFAEHEQALLLDSLTEVFAGTALVCAGGVSASLSVRALKAR